MTKYKALYGTRKGMRSGRKVFTSYKKAENHAIKTGGIGVVRKR
jgi:hypothetical protein